MNCTTPDTTKLCSTTEEAKPFAIRRALAPAIVGGGQTEYERLQGEHDTLRARLSELENALAIVDDAIAAIFEIPMGEAAASKVGEALTPARVAVGVARSGGSDRSGWLRAKRLETASEAAQASQTPPAEPPRPCPDCGGATRLDTHHIAKRQGLVSVRRCVDCSAIWPVNEAVAAESGGGDA